MQFAIAPGDDSTFETAAIVLRTAHDFQEPPDDVWAVLDGDQAWTWLPLCGVRYDQSPHGPGSTREMGTVRAPWRFLWIQRERFWRFEPGQRISYAAYSGSWPLLKAWAEDYTLVPLPSGGTRIVWTVAFTPVLLDLLPLRWTKVFLEPIFTLGFRPGMKAQLRRRGRRSPQRPNKE
ncbi:SRPBCC family protein [Segniliparus rugosus]|uniref:Polyketide cyclase / dehydrase and lipid transport n=1 Tax=Segniliparus rugosus (strain ATCC BAA-974 / DSM 45345 / CCUG 50838 / CIP 108380 / JCM 13579 / CDC 945) TaxID=679197 RepID=E5XR70_SEGRC|nr:SRPBCC family protein [Segniliparus rugosus]EFV13163.1 hypothetical protein HMPREF9336_01992 [Segniliparus rugosus ATCC BAA-974]